MQLRSLRSADASRLALIGLSDNQAIVRATAASSVTFLPASEAATALLPLLSDKDEFVRKEVAYSLGYVGDPASAPQLSKTLTSDKSPEVRVAAAVAIGKLGNPDAVPTLVKILDQRPTEANEVLRRAAARSIGQIAQIMRSGMVKVVTPQNFLPDTYKDIGPRPSPDLLSHFSSALPVLTRVLDSANETDDTRREAAFSLGAIGDNRAQSVLAKYVSSTDPYLAEICKEALLKLKAGE
jgi:HEAT repeat protein